MLGKLRTMPGVIEKPNEMTNNNTTRVVKPTRRLKNGSTSIANLNPIGVDALKIIEVLNETTYRCTGCVTEHFLNVKKKLY